MRRFLFLTTALLALSATTAQALVCIPLDKYRKSGGKLVHITNLDMTIPPAYVCNFSPCFGRVDMNGVVDKTGAVRGLKVTGNSWAVYPTEMARLVWAKQNVVRYAPPTLNGKPVCVGMRWAIQLQIDETPAKKKP
jgi:hypothetical protein